MSASIALVGNPNCGKTSLFNRLTKQSEYVGNFAGATVEQKEGWIVGYGEHIKAIDLPGLYSLTPYSQEEIIARKYILEQHPDVVVCVVDGTNIERNLYLTLQIMELGCPVVIAINQIDAVKAQGGDIDSDKLTRFLGVECIPISAKTGEGIEHLMKHTLQEAKKAHKPNTHGLYDEATEIMEDKIYNFVYPHATAIHIPVRWAALKLLEGDEMVLQQLALHDEDMRTLNILLDEFLNTSTLKDIDMILPEQRYRFIERITAECVTKKPMHRSLTTSEKIDSVMTNRYFALPIFFALMILMFAVTFGPVGMFLQKLTILTLNTIIAWVSMGLHALQAPIWIHSLIVDAVLVGISSILSFVPQIALLFIMLSLLEDTGYMARVAFIMDKAMRKLGLSGKSFIPMLMGFGCTTPAVMASRTMENDKNRRMTIMLTPFMSCGAKLPVYALFAGAFFAGSQIWVISSMYLLGIVVAILSGILLKKLVFSGEQSPFVMEFPQYRMPTLLSVSRHVWDNTKGFLIRAGTLIFAMSVIVWFLQTFNFKMEMVSDNSISMMGSIGKAIAPLLAPLGFGDWRAAVSLLGGFAAKEAVVSTAQLLYGWGNASAASVLCAYFTPLSAYCFMVFVLLSVPCISALATIKREMNSWKWTLGTLLYQMGIAYLITMAIYQIGRLFI